MTRRGFLAATYTLALGARQETGVLTGLVVDDRGQPVPGALLKAQHTVRQNTHQATSGQDGRYRFAALPAGSYHLYVTRRGYCSLWLRQVVVRPGQTTTRHVTLAIDSACLPRRKRGS